MTRLCQADPMHLCLLASFPRENRAFATDLVTYLHPRTVIGTLVSMRDAGLLVEEPDEAARRVAFRLTADGIALRAQLSAFGVRPSALDAVSDPGKHLGEGALPFATAALERLGGDGVRIYEGPDGEVLHAQAMIPASPPLLLDVHGTRPEDAALEEVQERLDGPDIEMSEIDGADLAPLRANVDIEFAGTIGTMFGHLGTRGLPEPEF